MDPADVKAIADKLWEDVSVIDEYLAGDAGDIPEEDRAIIESRKRKLSGKFILERHLKKGSVFISADYNRVYLVSGITSTWEEMFWYKPAPILMLATFIPFKDVIVTDGLVIPYNIVFGGNIKKQLKDTYMTAKKNGTLLTTL